MNLRSFAGNAGSGGGNTSSLLFDYYLMAILILFRDNLPENGVERRKENREMEKKPIFMTSGIDQLLFYPFVSPENKDPQLCSTFPCQRAS